MYFVSRQSYWPNGDAVVEVCTGGRDYCNPDMLVERYPGLGEGKEFADPVEAVEAAIKIRDCWNILLIDGEDNARVEVGNTGGFTMPFEDYPTDEWLRHWARKEKASLPRCGQCGGLLGDNPCRVPDLDDEVFCSENCAEKAWTVYWDDNMPEEEEEDILFEEEDVQDGE